MSDGRLVAVLAAIAVLLLTFVDFDGTTWMFLIAGGGVYYALRQKQQANQPIQLRRETTTDHSHAFEYVTTSRRTAAAESSETSDPLVKRARALLAQVESRR